MGAALCALTTFSCSKDKDSTVTPTVVAQIDPVALSAGMKVGYAATSVTGNIPAASTSADAPVLDSLYDNVTYYAISNRYIVIRPSILSGDVQGYYIQVNGAKSYYKIDYTTARNLRKAQKAASSKHSSAKEGDNSDSSIVIKLPANLVTDTFSISYAAYNANNQVSNSINAIIAVASSDSASNSLVTGNWRRNRYGNGIDDWNEDTIKYNNPDTSFYSYYNCNENGIYYYYYAPQGSQAIDRLPYYIQGYTNNDYSFQGKSQFTNTYGYIYKYINTGASSCSNYVYYDNSYIETYNGGYTYDAKTKTLIIIWDGDGYDNSNLYVDTYKVLSVTNQKMILVSYSNNDNHDELSYDYYEFKKL
ncbi:hypothetical protein FLA_3292 [Filimonas lacunae]|nr:hypothetical protein FLA_3292 [Filimonas lacunae]